MKNAVKSSDLIKSGISLTAAIIMLLSLTGCSAYSSRYRAVGFVHSNESASSFMNFYTFDGRMVFKMKSSGEGELTTLTGSAAKGSTIYHYSACLDARTTTKGEGGRLMISTGGKGEN